MRVVLTSGPLEGATRQVTSKPPVYIWVQNQARVLRIFRGPGEGRLAYRFDPDTKWTCSSEPGTLPYTIAQMTHRKCSGCGAFVERGGTCICGGLLVAL